MEIPQAIVCLVLNIPGSYDTAHAYVCREHADAYERESPNWIFKSRQISSLHVPCARCAQKVEK